MAMTRNSTVFGWLTALVLSLLTAAGVRAQPLVYPVYGSWGVSYVRFYPSYPGPLYSPAASPAGGQPAYAAPSNDSDVRPNYYSEDYAGPQGTANKPSKVSYIRVRVPTNAELWINNEKRTQGGTEREFVTPALDPDQIYVYSVKARWTEEGGINVEKTLRVRTISGTRVTVNFVRPPAAQPRPAAPAPVVAARTVTPAPRQVIEQRPVNWTSNVAPRSFRGSGD